MKPLKSKLPKDSEKTGPATGQKSPPNRPYQPHRHKRSIKLDRVNPRDLAKMESRFFCDDCVHYSPTKGICTMGYLAQHTQEEQMRTYALTGKMAFCRFLEID